MKILKLVFASFASIFVGLSLRHDYAIAAQGPVYNTNIPKMTYGRFLEYIDMGWVNKVDFYNNNKLAIVEASSPELGDRPQRIKIELPTTTSQLVSKLKTEKINFTSHKSEANTKKNPLISFIFPFLVVLTIVSLLRRSNNFMGGPGQLMNFRRARAKVMLTPDTGIKFDDVAGIDEAREELEEIVTFLKSPDRFTVVGAKIPRGVLLTGPPGTGKTLLARAVAGEAGVPFISMGGSEFVELFVGVGAARVRDLFQRARQVAPSIIFIDEIDAIGRERGAGFGGANDEREQTLNQLLTEMDGFRSNKGVIVLAATNRSDILDPALLRPGRFDRKVTINVPDKDGRTAILKVHAKGKKLAEDLPLDFIAQRTPGFSGADLANLLNEAAILTARYGKKEISINEVNAAIDRLISGAEGPTLPDGRDKRLVAFHEVGRAFVGTFMIHHEDVERITLALRGKVRGVTTFVPRANTSLVSRNQLMAKIVTSLAGRATEEVVFGPASVTTRASNDLRQVTNLARQMVVRYGMSGLGPLALEKDQANTQYSEESANKIDAYVKEIIDICYNEALCLIKQNRIVINRIVEKLVQKETLTGEELNEIISSYTEIPKLRPYESRIKATD